MPDRASLDFGVHGRARSKVPGAAPARERHTYRGIDLCGVCGFEGRGFGIRFDFNDFSKAPDFEFCSKNCLDIGATLLKANGGTMPDLTDMEKKAVVDARYQLAEALEKTGMMVHFMTSDVSVIDAIVTACVIGFQASMQRQSNRGEVPF